MNSFTIDIGNKIKLIVEQNSEPYQNEIGVYLEKNGNYQDLIRLTPYGYADLSNNNKSMMLKIWEDEDNEDFTREIEISLSEDLDE